MRLELHLGTSQFISSLMACSYYFIFFYVVVLQYPGLEPVLDDLLPKKAPLIVAKWLVSFCSLSVQVMIDFVDCV